MAKTASGAAFISAKKKAQERMRMRESGLEMDNTSQEEDVYKLQHHHLLECLERTTDREFVEMDSNYNGAPNKPSTTPPLSPSPSIQSLENRKSGCCARRSSSRKYLPTRQSPESGQEELNDIQIRLNRASRSSLNAVPATTSAETKENNTTTVTTAIITMPTSSNGSEVDLRTPLQGSPKNPRTSSL